MKFKLEIHHISYDTQYKPKIDKDILYIDDYTSIRNIFYLTRNGYAGLNKLIITDDGGTVYNVDILGNIQEVSKKEKE